MSPVSHLSALRLPKRRENGRVKRLLLLCEDQGIKPYLEKQSDLTVYFGSDNVADQTPK